jgi:hypothetical protein
METRGNRQKLTETTGDAQVSKTAGKITLEKPTETDGNRRKPTETDGASQVSKTAGKTTL